MKTEKNKEEKTEKGKIGVENRFSYITKMLNLIDDKQYPIYDQYVAKALALRRHYSQTKEVKNRYSGYLNCYNEIKRIYLELLREYTNGPIRVFKKMFDCPNHSSERVLDVIIWEIGKYVARKERY